MRFVLAGVHVEDQSAGGAAGGVKELGEEYVVDAVALFLGDGSFEAGKGGLAGEVGAGEGRAPHGKLESGIVAEGLGVVGVLVTGGDLINALAEQVFEGVVDAGLAPRVVEAGGDGLGEAEGVVKLGEQEEAAVGREGAAGEIDVNRFGRQERKVEHGLRIRHRRMFPFCAFRGSLNLLYARQAKCPPSFWEGHIADCARFRHLVNYSG
jgi:hypothetical protein